MAIRSGEGVGRANNDGGDRSKEKESRGRGTQPNRRVYIGVDAIFFRKMFICERRYRLLICLMIALLETRIYILRINVVKYQRILL